uniref:uncharacterized protein LOC109960166 n=1 Tax=Monopterus albus TaxID=43700 RepID=UPI0009B4CC1E|nr:uncharacterized protein LOC109960166 [Monopterus albus]
MEKSDVLEWMISMFKSLTVEQVRKLTGDEWNTPFQVATEVLIADLVLDIQNMLTHKWIIAEMNNENITFEQLQPILSEILTKSFSYFMVKKKLSESQATRMSDLVAGRLLLLLRSDMKEESKSDWHDELHEIGNDLIAGWVKMVINCIPGIDEGLSEFLGAGISNLVRLIPKCAKRAPKHLHPYLMKDSKSYIFRPMVWPNELNEMIIHACTVLEGISRRTYMLCRPAIPRIRPLISLKEGNLVKRTELIGEILGKAAEAITETLVRDVPDHEYEQLQVDCYGKIEAVAKDISQVTAEYQSQKHFVAARQNPKNPEWPTVTVKSIQETWSWIFKTC